MFATSHDEPLLRPHPVGEFEGVIADTPLRRLRNLVTRDDVEVYAKLEGTNLGGSVKDRAALSMITAAEQAGHLDGRRIVEATSGNTGIALAMIAGMKGLPITLIMPGSATPERVAIMKAYGAEVILTDAELRMEGAIDLARSLHAAGEHFMLDQFSNPANPRMHYETTGPELWAATRGRITHFVSAMGTTGTIMGVSRYLKEVDPSVQIIGCQPTDGSRIPGIRRWPVEYLPSIYEPERVDRIVDISADDAQATTRELARHEGLFVGMSAGGAAWGALKVAQEVPAGSVVVFITPDRGDKYLSMETLFPT